MRKKTINKIDSDRIKNSKIVAVMNNKGGVGKTTTSHALAMQAAKTGKNVLLVDSDPKCNLTLKLGLSEDVSPRQGLNKLFFNAEHPDSFQELSIIVKTPFLSNIKGSKDPVGTLAIIPGSNLSATECNAFNSKMVFVEYRDRLNFTSITHFYREAISYYKQFYDLIIIDTAPELNNSNLNNLAVKIADEIIVPIDGIEAAFGLGYLYNFVYHHTESNDTTKKPNVLFAMVKYHMDDKIEEDREEPVLNNAVFRVLKDLFGEFVCDNGVIESRKMGNTAQFSEKNDYTNLTDEIIAKITSQRANFFEQIKGEEMKIFNILYERLLEVLKKTTPNPPEFFRPHYK